MNDDPHLWSGLYAVDALEGDELARFEAHLATCPECRAEVDGFRETTATMASSAASTPPPATRDAVLAEVARTRQVPPVTDEVSHRRSRRRWMTVAAIAAAVVVIAGVAGLLVHDSSTHAPENDQIAAVVSRDDAKTVELSGEDHTSVKLVWSPSANEAVLLSNDLAAPPDGKTYELWAVAGDTAARAAVFRPDEDGRLRVHFPADMHGVDTVGVTVEPSGGSATPTSPMILRTTLR
jgi:anti-sigma-K factor RskA